MKNVFTVTNTNHDEVMRVDSNGAIHMKGTLNVGKHNVAMEIQRLGYILQRAVPNYDELNEQFNALQDIENASNER